MSELDQWDSFYVIVGSAAGTLIGLQFVVITLIAERPPLRATEAGAAFATPTIVYFSTTLLLSALQRVPWPSVSLAAGLWRRHLINRRRHDPQIGRHQRAVFALDQVGRLTSTRRA